MYIIFAGEKLETQLTCRELEETHCVHAIAEKNGMIAMACGDEGVKLFKYK